MSRSLAIAAIAGLAAGANAQECVSFLDAADARGLSTIVEFTNDILSALPENPVIEEIMAGVAARTVQDSRFTLFVPTDDAFAEIASVAATLSPEERLSVLLNHVLGDELTSADVTTALKAAAPADVTVTSLAGFALDISTEDDYIFVTPYGSDVSAEIIDVDIDTCLGTVHIVDKVLVPSLEDAKIMESGGAGGYGDEEIGGVYGEEEAGTSGRRGRDGMMTEGDADIAVDGADMRDAEVVPVVAGEEDGTVDTGIVADGGDDMTAGGDSVETDETEDAETIARAGGNSSRSTSANRAEVGSDGSSDGGISGAAVGGIAAAAVVAVLAAVAAGVIYNKRRAGAAAGAGSVGGSGALSGTTVATAEV